MGMNYWCKEPGNEPLHIGKSSAGWCFALHVIPEIGLNSPDDWMAVWRQPGVTIYDGSGRYLTPNEMLARITNRGPLEKLRRCVLDSDCIAHGPGSWDCIVGYFS